MWYNVFQKVVQYSSQVSIFEDGAKNPLKSISMKFLVLAYNAQLWVGAGSKGVGQSQRHATLTLHPWRPLYVLWKRYLKYGNGLNLYCGKLSYVQSSLP